MTQLMPVDIIATKVAAKRWYALMNAQFKMAERWEDAKYRETRASWDNSPEERKHWQKIEGYRYAAMLRLQGYCALEIGRMAIGNPWLVGR